MHFSAGKPIFLAVSFGGDESFAHGSLLWDDRRVGAGDQYRTNGGVVLGCGPPDMGLVVLLVFSPVLTVIFCQSVKVKRGRQKGDGKKNVRKCHHKSAPFPSNPILSEAPPLPLPLMSSEVQKRGKLVREVRGLKDKTNGRERDALS